MGARGAGEFNFCGRLGTVCGEGHLNNTYVVFGCNFW